MVEKFCMTVTSRLIDEELISDSQADIYTYELQMIVESLLAHTLLLLLAAISGCFLKVCVFVISFDMLRQFSGGYHCKTFKGCCFLSLLVTLMIITLENTAIELWAICQGGVTISMIFVIYIGAINHPDLCWSNEEYAKAKKYTRSVVIIIFTLFLLFDSVSTDKCYLYYWGMGIVVCSLSLLLSKMLGKEERE